MQRRRLGWCVQRGELKRVRHRPAGCVVLACLMGGRWCRAWDNKTAVPSRLAIDPAARRKRPEAGMCKTAVLQTRSTSLGLI
jgi:hypothetical protein